LDHFPEQEHVVIQGGFLRVFVGPARLADIVMEAGKQQETVAPSRRACRIETDRPEQLLQLTVDLMSLSESDQRLELRPELRQIICRRARRRRLLGV